MEIFDLMQSTNSNEVVFFEEPSVNLRAIIVLNDTVLGPALATCRIYDFKNLEKASKIALQMAYYNTYRSALLRRSFGGGSIVLFGDSDKVKNEMYLRALGIFVNKLNGKLFLARSSGISDKDMHEIKRESNYLLGIDEKYIKTGNSPVEAIAKGMIWGLKAAVKEKIGADSINNLTFAVQGVGEVGANLIKELLKFDTNIIVTDVVYDKIKVIQDKVPGIKVVKPNEIYKQKCDVFISCAFNNIMKEEDIQQLNCKILTGSTNSVLKTRKMEKAFNKTGILYVPGYIINGGEIIQLANEHAGKSPESVDVELPEIYDITLGLIKKAKQENKLINDVAMESAKKYINDVATIKKLK